IDLLLTRSEDIPSGVKKALIDSLLPRYLSESQTLNKELCKILSYLQVSEIIAPTLEKMETDTIVTEDQKSIYLSSSVSARSDQYGKDVERMLANMPNQQNISYAKSLSAVKSGWTNELNEKYFKWYNKALKRSGGKQYAGFIRAIQQLALNNVDEADRQFYEAMAGEGLKGHSSYMANVTQPKGPGKNWTKKIVLASYGKGIKPNFESGKNLYRASLCISCHSISGEGGSAGPELTRVGTRFSVGDLAEAIIDPSATVSDRYRNTKYFMEDGKEIIGRQIEENERNITISTNPFSPDLTTPIRKSNIVKEEESPNSPMPAGLLNRLNDQEMNDLIAYLLAGGSQDAQLYK
ncbi:MAG: c-type cytochrome, partial [Cyclobacteriaceae bacterium]|nr:c-type cytochrome [Cyclobacteriaceae bacterium]